MKHSDLLPGNCYRVNKVVRLVLSKPQITKQCGILQDLEWKELHSSISLIQVITHKLLININKPPNWIILIENERS